MNLVHLRLKKKLEEVFLIEPNNLGVKILTDWYKKLTAPLKTAPFIIIIPLSFLVGMILYLIFNQILVAFVSFLQYGF